MSLRATVAGNYTFSLNAASTVNPVLTVTRTSPSKDLTTYVRAVSTAGHVHAHDVDGEDATRQS